MSLGRSLRGYSKTAAMTATSALGDSPLFLLDYLLRFLRVLVLLALWRAVFAGRIAASGLTLGSVLTYTLISEVFADALASQTGIDETFWDGSVLLRFLRPQNLFAQFAAEMAGPWSVNFALFSLPLLLCAPLLGVDPLPASAARAALFGVSLVLAVAVGIAVDYLFAGLMVAFTLPSYAIAQIRLAVGSLLSGALLPLALLPWGIGRVFAWLPFAAMASAPLQIYTGTGSPLRLLTLQTVWVIILWALVNRLWRANRERMVSYGG